MKNNDTGANPYVINPNRLVDLRRELARLGLDGFLVPRADEHLGEYVPACAERLAWLTGFTGSSGFAVVLAERAAVFTDGRYVLQLASQTDPDRWERRHIIDEPPAAWLAGAAPRGARIGYDPCLLSEGVLGKYTAAGIDMVAVAANPIDAVWHDRPAAPSAHAWPHALDHAGQAGAEKTREVAGMLREAGQDAAVISDPASVAWLLNLRGADIPFTPVPLGFAILHADATVELFMAAAKLDGAARAWLGDTVSVANPGFGANEPLAHALARLAGRRVRVDASGTSVWFAQTLRAAGAEIVDGMDPCLLPKACKNAVERQGARDAHARDAVALCRFLHWLDTAAGHATEMSAAARLLAYRAELDRFKGESFPAISGAGEHGAIIHYRVEPETDRALNPNETYLIDSGAQFADGTTDVTRTIWTGPGEPPAELRDRFTRVLQGHIALAAAVFPKGVCGPHLDALARRALWLAGLDYDHGTGHGVGSYLSVHEGPASISRAGRMVALAPGMILSDEPGFYAPGQYGIRLENLLLVQPAEFATSSARSFLSFETLTLAPFDRRLLSVGKLSSDERTWLDAYHARVADQVAPHLAPDERAWLIAACAPV